MHFLLFLVLVSAVGLKGLQVHDPSDPVVAEVGRAVLLPCTAQKSMSLEDLQVEWKKTDSDSVVIVFEKGKSKPELQSPTFKARVDIFPDEMSKGNFSILLQNVVKEDAGVYRCKVSTVQDSFETTVTIKTTDLLVVKGTNRITYDSVGDEVILNCSVNVPAQEIEEVTWKKKDGDLLVLLFQNNETFFDSSHESYRERAEFFITEIPKGNFSLKLKDVRVEDKGEFICEVHTRHASGSTTVVLQSVANLLLKGADQTVSASAGDEVILNCSVDSHQPVQDIEEVTWKKKDGDLLILLLQNTETFSDSSHESYQGRAEFFITEIPKGNFSLKLKDVRLEDKGEFICEIHTSNMSGRTVVVLDSVGFSRLHILTLILCIAALLITVGIFFLTSLLKNKITSRMDLMIQVTLMICPKMCLGVAFILWLKEGFLSEVVICSAVCFTRPIILMKTSPYLNTLPGCFQKAMKDFASLIHHVIIITAAMSTLIEDIHRDIQATRDLKATLTTVFIVLYFIGPSLSVICIPFCRMRCFVISVTLNRLLILSMVLKIDLDLYLQIISILPPLFLTMTMVLTLQSYYIQGKLLKGLLVAMSFMVILYTLVHIGYYVLITVDTSDYFKGWIILFEAVIFIIVWIAVICLLRSHRKAFWCLQQRGKGYLWCTVAGLVLTIVFGAFYLYYTATLLAYRKDGAGYIPLTFLVYILAATAMFDHPEHVPGWLHIMIYRFGTLGLTAINSITLASELIQKAVKGARTIEDLRLIVLPFETLIVVIWLALQLYETWLRIKDRLNQERGQTEEMPEVHEMKPLQNNINQQT